MQAKSVAGRIYFVNYGWVCGYAPSPFLVSAMFGPSAGADVGETREIHSFVLAFRSHSMLQARSSPPWLAVETLVMSLKLHTNSIKNDKYIASRFMGGQVGKNPIWVKESTSTVSGKAATKETILQFCQSQRQMSTLTMQMCTIPTSRLASVSDRVRRWDQALRLPPKGADEANGSHLGRPTDRL